MAWQKIVVLDFNSQQAHKITKTLRLLGYHSEIKPPSTTIESLKGATGIILSDGPGLGFTKTKIQLFQILVFPELPRRTSTLREICFLKRPMPSWKNSSVS